MKIKILYIIDKMKPAGAQRHLQEVLAGLDKERFEARLVTLAELGVKRIYGLSGLRGLVKLVRLMRAEKFDIVHTYLFSENILGVIAARIAGVKVIVTGRRDTGMLREGGWVHMMAYKFTNRWVKAIVCVSNAVRKVVLEKEGVEPGKAVVIYNGVDVAKFEAGRAQGEAGQPINDGRQEQPFVIGMIANFSWIKGHKEFIEAAAIVAKKAPNVKFLLIGEGPLRPEIEARAKELGLQDKVDFLGKREDVPALLATMDISVNASYSEGMSNTILESMAAGVPVVATATDGNLETVVSGKTGLLVPPRDSGALAEAILKIVEDPDLARMYALNARKRIEQEFTGKIMIGNMQALYTRLLSPRVAFIFSQFPSYDETFILRELNGARAHGLEFLIYSLKSCRDQIVHREAQPLVAQTRYMPFVSLKLFFINLFSLARYPRWYLAALGFVVVNNFKSANFLVKSVALFPQAVGWAWQARKDKIDCVHGQWATFPATTAFVVSKLNRIPFSFTGHAHDIYLDTTGLAEKIRRAAFVVTCTGDNKHYLTSLCRQIETSRGSDMIDNGCKVLDTRRNTCAKWEAKPEAARAGNEFPSWAHRKIFINYHGLDLSRFSANGQPKLGNGEHRAFKILSVGSLLECKGYDTLIEACRILRDKKLRFECTIAGGGKLEHRLRTMAHEMGLDEHIKFTGYITQDKLVPLYKQADVFVLLMKPEKHWGIPNVLIEAMAVKLPVICTYLPSIPELVQDGRNGFIVAPGNPRFAAQIIERLYNDGNLRAKIGVMGRRVVEEKFDVVANSRALKELFDGSGMKK